MRVVSSIFLCFFVTACSPSKLEQLEVKYHKSVKNGDINKQVQLVDKLYELAPKKYENLFVEKKQLTPYINILLHSSNNMDHHSLTSQQLEALVNFSPSFQAAKELIKGKQREKDRQKSIAESLKRIAQIYTTTKKKITNVPSHVEERPTDIVVNHTVSSGANVTSLLELLEIVQHKKLNTYHVETLLSGLNSVAMENGLLFEQASVSVLYNEKYEKVVIEATAQNREIYQLICDMYAQQLLLTLHWTEKQNIQLQNLVRTALGIRDLNLFWQKEYQPTASNMQRFAEKHHLNTLNSIHNYRLSIPLITEDEKVEMLVPQQIKKLILSLLWPNKDIYDFYEQSEAQLALFEHLVG